MTTAAEDYLGTLSADMNAGVNSDIPGWFTPVDGFLLDAVNRLQGERGTTGDVLEIGVFRGKCAILLGWFPRDGERMVICDPFAGDTGITASHPDESINDFSTLSRDVFERNYLRFHDELPVMHVMASENLRSAVEPGSCRLVHIDGNHAYAAVKEDIAITRELLGPGGIVVVDDWSGPHLPGVAMALWEEYLTGDLVPLAISRGKFYATWDTAGPTAGDLDRVAAGRDRLSPTEPRLLGTRTARYYRETGSMI